METITLQKMTRKQLHNVFCELVEKNQEKLIKWKLVIDKLNSNKKLLYKKDYLALIWVFNTNLGVTL